MAVTKGEGQVPGVRSAAARRAEEQGLLFGDELAAQPAPAPAETSGYRGPMACAAAGITYRQLDYWARTGLVEPSVRPATGSGSQRLYGFRDVSVYECTSADEVVDLLQGGQGVFGIALGRVWQEVEGSLAELPAEQAAGGADDGALAGRDADKADELSRRRARKIG